MYNASRFRVVKRRETVIETSHENFVRCIACDFPQLKILCVRVYRILTNKRNLNRICD